MIKKLILKNFMSWKSLEIDFSTGMNVICGKSDNGKSNIQRAMDWILKNRPSNNDMCSDWIKKNTKTGNTTFTGVTEATIIFTDGSFVTRAKGKDTNEYRISGIDEPLKAPGMSVPEEVLKIMNMSELNIQNQFAGNNYMLCKSSAEIGRDINEFSNLSDIDKLFKFIDSRIRKNNSDIKTNNKILSDNIEKQSQFHWVDKTDKQLSGLEFAIIKYEKLENSICNLRITKDNITKYKKELDKLNKLHDSIVLHDEIQKIIEKTYYMSSLIKDMSKTESLLISGQSSFDSIGNIDETEDKLYEISSKMLLMASIQTKIKNQKSLKQKILDIKYNPQEYKKIKSASIKFKRCGSMVEQYQKLNIQYNNMIDIEEKALDSLENIEKSEIELAALKKELTYIEAEVRENGICPLCGRS